MQELARCGFALAGEARDLDIIKFEHIAKQYGRGLRGADAAKQMTKRGLTLGPDFHQALRRHLERQSGIRVLRFQFFAAQPVDRDIAQHAV